MSRLPCSFAAAALTLAAGCAAEVTEVRLGDLDFAYAFTIFLNDAGDPLRVGPVFGRLDEQAFGVNALALQDGEARVLLITMTEEELKAAVARYDRERGLELGVELAPPPTRPTLVDQSATSPPFQRAALPDDASFYVVDIDGQRRDVEALTRLEMPDPKAQGAVTMIVPIDPECGRDGQLPLRPFAKEAKPITTLTAEDPRTILAYDLLWLDDDAVIVVGFREVFLVRRNELWVSSPTTAFALINDDRRFHDGAAEAPAADGTQTAWIAGGYPGEPADDRDGRVGARGALFRVVVGPDGIRSVQTATETPGHQLYTAEVAEDGTVLVGGDDGFMLEKAPGATEFTRRLPDLRVRETDPGENWVTAIASFDFAPRPWLVGTQGLLHEYDADNDRWIERFVRLDVITQPQLLHFSGIDGRIRGDGDIEFWASADSGGLVRRIGVNAPWTPLLPNFPPRFAPCASPPRPGEPELYSLKTINDLTVQDGFLYLAYQNCTAVVVVPMVDVRDPAEAIECTGLLTPLNEGPEFTRTEYTAFASRPGELLVLRGDGLLLSSTW